MPSSSPRLILVKNAIYNVLRGGSGALISVALPPLLTRILSKDTFNVWVLILQIGIYVNFFEFGTQTAVGTYIAQSTELKDFKQRDSVISTSIALLSVCSVIVSGLLILLAFNFSIIFSDIPKSLNESVKYCILILGLSLSLGLPFSTFLGLYIGLQRYDIPGIISATSKLIGALGVLFTALLKENLVLMAGSIAFSNLIAYVLQFAAARKVKPKINISFDLITPETVRKIINYCSGLLIWNVGMLFVSGLDTVIVGFLDYKSIAYYALAVTITNIIIQLHAALFGVLLPTASKLAAKEDEEGLGDLLISSTRYSSIILLVISLPFILFAKQILTIWVGSTYADSSAPILQVLIVANIIRLSGLPYALLILATGQQRKILLSPLLEGITNFLVSIILAKLIGVIGVAIGTVIGSFVSIGIHLCFSMPRTSGIRINRKHLLERSILSPLLSAFPYILVVVSNYYFKWLSPSAWLVSTIISFILLWNICLSNGDKSFLKRALRINVNSG